MGDGMWEKKTKQNTILPYLKVKKKRTFVSLNVEKEGMSRLDC